MEGNMKTVLISLLVLCMGGHTLAVASPGDVFTGAAAGAALGWVIGEHSHRINSRDSIIVGGLAGAAIGHIIDRQHHAARRERAVKSAPLPPEKVEVSDPHPGVDLIKVSILHSNGIRTDIPLLRVKGKFVGPQGETYETLPSSEVLAARYGM
jgi:hypothetical protein